VPADDRTNDDFDDIARSLRELRARAGGPSYAEIGSRIALARIERGVPVSASVPARTTVYDAFRLGRSRINAALVGEIVRALGADDAEAEGWETRCGLAQKARHAAPARPTPPPVRQTAAQPVTQPAAQHSALWTAILLVGCVVLNFSGSAAVATLGLPLFLDMIGTAVAAMAFGPWWGVLVAAGSTAVETVSGTTDSLPFGLVNIAGALAWGYGVRAFGGARSLPRFFALSLIVGVVCTIVSVPVLMTVFGGETGHASDQIAEGLVASGEELAPAVFTANLLTSLADKLISGFIALAVIGLLPARMLKHDLVGSMVGRMATGESRRDGETRTDAALHA
jgi:energy-coupling factor transport system substrate-specific component